MNDAVVCVSLSFSFPPSRPPPLEAGEFGAGEIPPAVFMQLATWLQLPFRVCQSTSFPDSPLMKDIEAILVLLTGAGLLLSLWCEARC